MHWGCRVLQQLLCLTPAWLSCTGCIPAMKATHPSLFSCQKHAAAQPVTPIIKHTACSVRSNTCIGDDTPCLFRKLDPAQLCFVVRFTLQDSVADSVLLECDVRAACAVLCCAAACTYTSHILVLCQQAALARSTEQEPHWRWASWGGLQIQHARISPLTALDCWAF